MVGGCGSDAPRLLGEAAKQPDTFQETGGKHFLGLNPRLHSLHQEERNAGGQRVGAPQPIPEPPLREPGGLPSPSAPPTPLLPTPPPILQALLPTAPGPQPVPEPPPLTCVSGPARPAAALSLRPGRLPSPGPAGPGPPAARPAGPPLIVASPGAGPATSGCALLSSSPPHAASPPTRRNTTPQQLAPGPPPATPPNSLQRSASPLHFQPGTALPAGAGDRDARPARPRAPRPEQSSPSRGGPGTGERHLPAQASRTSENAEAPPTAPPRSPSPWTAAPKAFQHSPSKGAAGGRDGEFCGSIAAEGRGRSPGGGSPARRTETRRPAPTLPQPPPPPASTPGPRRQANRSPGPGTEAHCSLPRLLPRSPSAPRGGPSGRGPRGERRGAGRRPRPPRAEAGREWVAGRRGGAGGSAAARRVLLLGRRRLQPSSLRQAAPGVRSTFSRSVPHAAPPRGSGPGARTPPGRALPSQKQQFGDQRGRGGGARARQRCADLGVPSERPALGARGARGARAGGAGGRAGARPAPCVRRSPSARRAPTCGPSSHCWAPGRGGAAAAAPQQPGGEDSGSGSGAVQGRGAPRTAAAGTGPPTIPRNAPVSDRLRSGTSACGGRAPERRGGEGSERGHLRARAVRLAVAVAQQPPEHWPAPAPPAGRPQGCPGGGGGGEGRARTAAERALEAACGGWRPSPPAPSARRPPHPTVPGLRIQTPPPTAPTFNPSFQPPPP
ncbi:basic proline-rich protein-like [Equus przewalskii]|uniref:Basic proline-rich protein-like n=1 Tax=Equus przewalskii TaxID=9798 RepID=A0ABM4M5F2_EQUPR